jgi:hypothetical protein
MIAPSFNTHSDRQRITQSSKSNRTDGACRFPSGPLCTRKNAERQSSSRSWKGLRFLIFRIGSCFSVGAVSAAGTSRCAVFDLDFG